MIQRTLCGGLALSLFLAVTATAQAVSITPVKDNTLFEPDMLGERSSALGPQFFAGRVGGFGGQVGLRRGLIKFDVAGSVPAGATVTSVTLGVTCSRVPIFDNGTPRTHRLQRATANWGEGHSDAGINNGSGAVPTLNDATWSDAFFSSTPWGTAGGDFTGTVSSSVSVPTTGNYVFPSSAQLVADVQDMLDSPAGNFGWVVTGDEVTASVARGFDSREAPTYPLYGGTAPVLQIQYTYAAAVPALSTWATLALAAGALGVCVFVLTRRSAA